jgi:exopolyphosphatase
MRGVAASFRDFLLTSRRALLNPSPTYTSLHLVLGNEACDADSIVSALTHAFRLHAEAHPSTSLVAPIVSCKRAEWPLRREAASLLAEALLDPASAPPRGSPEAASALGDMLLFLDDAAPVAAVARARGADGGVPLRATLTDHNLLDGGGRALGLRDADVVGIVDHHEDMGGHAAVVGAARNVSYDPAARRGVGSTCTLVAGALLAEKLLDGALARALLGVVLLDTCGLAPAAGKTTPEDLRVAAALRECAGVGEAEGATMYEALCALRFEAPFWRSLPPAVALAYDFKGFGSFGTAAICEPAGVFLGAAGGALAAAPLAACAHAAATRGLPLFLLLSMAQSAAGAPFERQLAVVMPPPSAAGGEAARRVLARLRACEELRLSELAAGRAEGGWEGVLFAQGNAVASRKQVVPLVQGWLRDPQNKNTA